MRTQLEARRDGLVDAGDVEIEAESDGETVHKVDEDSAPHTEMSQVIASNRNRQRARELREIADALRRMGEDPEGFGLCESCDEPIPTKRLALMPWVRLCLDCQREQETSDGPNARRHVTDYR